MLESIFNFIDNPNNTFIPDLFQENMYPADRMGDFII